MKKLHEYLPEVLPDLTKQLIDDDARWGDTWIKRGREGQEDRFMAWVGKKYYEYRMEGKPFPWLKVMGEGLIGEIRQRYL